ncbi:MAG: acyl-CoA thioesterase [Oceanicaulis sp.]|nr:acyl-CoA thioesterase [Oceanicaulis sp.]
MSGREWDLPGPFVHRVAASTDDIDIFGHANNAAYLRWADETAWAHWESCGFTRQDCLDEDRGMAIMRTEADYLGHCRDGEALDCAVWIARSDGRLRAERWYQFRRAGSSETVFRAVTRLVCFQLSTGRPARMTGPFATHYAPPRPVLAAAADALMTKLKR